MISQQQNAVLEKCNELPQHLYHKNAFHNIKFQTEIEFHKHFQCDGWLCNRMANFEIRAWVFDSVNLFIMLDYPLISCLRFDVS